MLNGKLKDFANSQYKLFSSHLYYLSNHSRPSPCRKCPFVCLRMARAGVGVQPTVMTVLIITSTQTEVSPTNTLVISFLKSVSLLSCLFSNKHLFSMMLINSIFFQIVFLRKEKFLREDAIKSFQMKCNTGRESCFLM